MPRGVFINTLLSELYHRIDSSYQYYFSGKAELTEKTIISKFHNRFNTLTQSGNTLTFSYATLNDLEFYDIKNKSISFGDFEITYKVNPGQDVLSLKEKINGQITKDILSAETKIALLKEIISAKGYEEIKHLIHADNLDSEELFSALQIKANELLRIEETRLLQIQSMRKNTR